MGTTEWWLDRIVGTDLWVFLVVPWVIVGLYVYVVGREDSDDD